MELPKSRRESLLVWLGPALVIRYLDATSTFAFPHIPCRKLLISPILQGGRKDAVTIAEACGWLISSHRVWKGNEARSAPRDYGKIWSSRDLLKNHK
jgi:hypothetical protein